MPIDTRGLALAEELGGDVRALRLDVGDLATLTTVDQDSLVEAINELQAAITAIGGGGSGDLEGLSDVDLTTPADGDILQFNGSGVAVNVTKATFLGANLTALDVASSAYSRTNLFNLADQAALRTVIGTGSDTVVGLLELATTAETIAGASTGLAVTPAGVAAAIAAVVDAAPGTLDTLNELAAALGDDPNFATTITASIGAKQAGHANLTAFSGLTLIADRLPYANGSGTLALTPFTAAARTVLDDASVGDMRTTLSVYSKAEIGDPETDLLAAYVAARDA